MEFLLGVDVGGTKIAVGSMDSTGNLLHSASISSLSDSQNDLWGRLEEVSREVIEKTQGNLTGIGIGSAGPINIKQGTVSPVNIAVWREFPLVNSFKNAFECEKVQMHGDAIAMTHAEYKFGAGKGAQNMIGLVVSTGIGGGLVLNNELQIGETGNAGYFGHSTIHIDGEICPCGRKGCVEVYASGPHMVRKAKSMGWSNSSDDFLVLAESARTGNEIAIKAIADGADALAVGIVNVAATVDVGLVVVGGGVSRAGDVYWSPLLSAIKRRAEGIEFLTDMQVRPAKLDSDAGVIGAALAAL